MTAIVRSARRGLATAACVAAALSLVACAPSDSESTSSSTPSASGSGAATAGPSSLCPGNVLSLTQNADELTIGTDKPAYSPWFVDDNPSNGKGFESAVAYAVAAKLGFDTSHVRWVVASFNSAIAPGPKSYDVDINQISITNERRKAVDFSSGYYDVAQAIVSVKGSPAASAKSINDLKKVKFGAAVGTTSYRAITDTIKPGPQPAVYDDNDKAKLALSNGQIDALVVDLPTALYLAAAELKDGVVVGQLAGTPGAPEQFGFVLAKGSKLTPCVSAAVDALRADGTLKKLEQQWLTTSAGAPVLQ